MQLPVNNLYVDDLNMHYSGCRQTTSFGIILDKGYRNEFHLKENIQIFLMQRTHLGCLLFCP